MSITKTLENVCLFDMRISRVSMAETVDLLLDWCHSSRRKACRFVVTPNVDHVVMYQHRADFRAAYESASLVLADGMPIVLSARMLGQELPERVAGSDLIPAIFAAAKA